MIRFLLTRSPVTKKIRYSVCGREHTVKQGERILKIVFDQSDVHVSRSGQAHLDIWGKKLDELRKLLRGKPE